MSETKISRTLFGTDGIRSRANTYPMTADLVLRLGQAAGVIFHAGEHRHAIVIGKDTRLSGYLFESALQAGFTSMGINCLLVGPMPTPAIAFLTRALRADAGVVISASHNPHYDNGIKFFDANGMKLPDATELRIEEILFGNDMAQYQPGPEGLGRAFRINDAAGRYTEFCKNTFPRHLSLGGIRIVVDCANGSAYKLAPAVFWELGAEVITIGDKPNGININQNCGTLHPEGLRTRVLETGSQAGFALDGDADRLLVCDEKGNLLDGDHLLAMNALDMQKKQTLKGGAVVATVMSNLGLELLLQEHGIPLIRADVGDRYVIEQMIRHGCNLGGEQSGHLLFLDHNTTGDGIISALRVLELMVSSQRPLSELAACMEIVPQVLKNIPISQDADPLANPRVLEAIQQAELELGKRGRVLVRKSGTESKIRVMVEGSSHQRIDQLCDEIIREIQAVAGV